MKFRWIPYALHKPAWNMAVDEAILEARLRGVAPPTLRFYGWAPPAVSLGYAQRLPLHVIEEIRKRELDVVRRPTGGRAVLHEGELTYSFIGSSSDGATSNSTTFNLDAENLSSSVSVSYLQICQGLLKGFENLDVKAEIGRGHGGYTRFEDCFQTTTNADLQIDGLKAVGSAQLKRKSAVLQHGSILLQQSQELMPSLVDQPLLSVAGKAGLEQKEFSTKRHVNLFELIETRDVKDIESAFVKGFNEAFAAEFERCELTKFETDLAESLLSKYQV